MDILVRWCFTRRFDRFVGVAQVEVLALVELFDYAVYVSDHRRGEPQRDD